MNFKLALVFLVIFAVALKSTQGKSIHEIKENVEELKKPLIAAKVGIAAGVAAKVKFLALKKVAAVKTIVAAPFVLGKKAALLKIKAIKSLAALKAAKAKKVLNYAKEKTAPAVALVTGIPAALLGKLKPKPASQVQVVHQTEVIDNIYTTYPDHGQNYNHHQQQQQQLQQQEEPQQYQIPSNTNYHYYKGLDAPRTYTNDYSLVPDSDSGSQYYPVSDIIQPHETYGVPAN